MNRGQKIALGIIAGVPVVCCLGGILTFTTGLSRASGTLDDDLRTLRNHGFPTEPEDLKSKSSIPREQNAAPLYTEAAKLLDENGPAHLPARDVAKALSPKRTDADRQKGAESFKKLARLVALAEKAADLPQCDFNRDWSQGFYLRFPEYQGMKDLTRLLAYKAEVQSDRGDWKGAMQSIARAQRIARHAGVDHTLIGMLVQIANETITITVMRRIVDDHGRNPAALAQAKKTLAGFGPLPDMRRAMGGELVMSRLSIRNLASVDDIAKMSSGTDGESAPRPSGSGIPLGMFRKAFDARLVREYVTLEQGLPKDSEEWTRSRQAMADVEKRVEADNSPLGVLNQILLPIGVQAADAIGKLQAERHLTATGIYLLEARMKGGLPPVLPSSGKMFKDPFDGETLRYVHRGSGFTLYSIGNDRKDSGGKPRSTGSTDFDIVANFR